MAEPLLVRPLEVSWTAMLVTGRADQNEQHLAVAIDGKKVHGGS